MSFRASTSHKQNRKQQLLSLPPVAAIPEIPSNTTIVADKGSRFSVSKVSSSPTQVPCTLAPPGEAYEADTMVDQATSPPFQCHTERDGLASPTLIAVPGIVFEHGPGEQVRTSISRDCSVESRARLRLNCSHLSQKSDQE